MPRTQLGAILEFIRATLTAQGLRDRTDAELLDRFVAQRDEAAYTALLQRHGPLVLSVCRRVLGNSEDVDDAFQATFLVLVRKAGSIRKSGSVASWLHGVAHRVALKARRRAARRWAHEKRAQNMRQADPADDAAASELRSILDEELERLPQKYRDPLLLHYFAGKTKEATAQQLGWSEGTVSGRLAHARDLLRDRLARRGVVLSAGALSAALSQEAAVASVSSILASSTVNLATLFAAGDVAAGASTARVLALTERVVHTMFLTKLKITAEVLLVVAAVGLGAAGLYGTLAEQPPVVQAPPAPVQLRADPGALAKEPVQVKKPGVIVKAPGHTLDVALSPDGKTVARAGTGKTIELWDVASGKQLHTLKGQSNMWPPVFKVAFSPDGKTLASATESVEADKAVLEVKLWDVATGKERVPLKGRRSGVYSLAFSADGKTLATSHMDPGGVRVWDVATGKEKIELGAFGSPLAFSPDGKTLALGGDSVQLWDLTTGKKRASMPETRHVSLSLAFTPDGKTLVSAGRTKKEKLYQLKLWDVATAKERATIAMSDLWSPSEMLSIPLVCTADGKTLITAGWIFEKDKETKEFMWHDSYLVGRVSVQHWDLATGKARATFWTPVNPGGTHEFSGNVVGMYFAALSADGKTVAWGGADPTGTAHVWEVESLATSPPEIPKEVAEKNKAAAEEKKDNENLLGTWKLRAVEINGRRKDSKHLQTQMRIHWVTLDLDTPEGRMGAYYRIDASRRPKTIDIASHVGTSTGKFAGRKITVKAIYLLEGDRLTICKSAIDTEARPTEFKTQPDDGLTLEIYERAPPEQPIPGLPIFIKPGETKTVTLGDPGKEGGPLQGGAGGVSSFSNPWKVFKKELTLTFADTDVPKGVIFEPANPVVKNPDEVPKFTIRAAQDAALGDFAIAVYARVDASTIAIGQLYLSVDPAGEAAREPPGQPRRRYRRLSDDLSIAHDGKLLSIAAGKLIMKSKDGKEHSYTLADKFGSDIYAWQITYDNSGSITLEDLKARLKARQVDPATPVFVRVTATKAKPQEPTHIQAEINSYDAFGDQRNERGRQEKEQQDIEREKQEIEHQKKVQQEIDRLQGTWLVVSSQTGNEKEPLESLKKKRVIIKGDHLTLAFGNERNEKRAGTIKIDPPPRPPLHKGGQGGSLDWVIPKAGDAAMEAIYELKGDDLKIGFGVDGLLRPTRFEMGKDQIGWLLVLKRDKTGPLVPPADDAEAKAVEAITKLGGKVTRDDKLPGKPVIAVILAGTTKVTDAGLKELKHLKQLTALTLGGLVTAAGLKELKELKQLTSLDLQFTPVTDAGLKELKHLKQLTTLNLTATPVTDAGLKELKDLKQLTTLNLGAKVTDDGVAALQKALPGCKIGR